MTPTRLRIGSRGSPLALAQAHEVRARLRARFAALAEEDALEIVVIKTTGDLTLDRTLADIGGKGLFTKEIEDALLAGRIDIAVHSMKDVPTWLPDGLVIDCLLPREDPRDVLLSRNGLALSDLPAGAVVGTASLRRRAQVLARRPDLAVVPLRGNVGTRLDKLARGEVDATLLALAGLRRLGQDAVAHQVLDPADMLPAVAQGAIGIECRADDGEVQTLLAQLDHPPTALAVAAERAMLARLDGSCRTPIAGLAVPDGDGRVERRGLIAKPDGAAGIADSEVGPVADAVEIGTELGARLARRAGPGFLESA
ncbi:MAG: hydroxymethylbilane synthase [Alphaproteobacteria bacterium]|nr:hydroxymethylbilane synthase [Alphaproteobacteria bacterium]